MISCQRGRQLDFNGYKIIGNKKLGTGVRVISVEMEDRIKTGVLDSLSSLINYREGGGSQTNINYYLKGTNHSMAYSAYTFVGSEFQSKIFAGMTYEEVQKVEKRMNDAGAYSIYENTESDGSLIALGRKENNYQLLRLYPNSELETIQIEPHVINGIVYWENDGDMPIRIHEMDSTVSITDLVRYRKHNYFLRSMTTSSINRKDAEIRFK